MIFLHSNIFIHLRSLHKVLLIYREREREGEREREREREREHNIIEQSGG